MVTLILLGDLQSEFEIHWNPPPFLCRELEDFCNHYALGTTTLSSWQTWLREDREQSTELEDLWAWNGSFALIAFSISITHLVSCNRFVITLIPIRAVFTTWIGKIEQKLSRNSSRKHHARQPYFRHTGHKCLLWIIISGLLINSERWFSVKTKREYRWRNCPGTVPKCDW